MKNVFDGFTSAWEVDDEETGKFKNKPIKNFPNQNTLKIRE